MDTRDLLAAALDIERHVASDGWDQPALLFALVATARIRVEQPELAARLGVVDGGPVLTTFEQPAPPKDKELDAFLATIAWPDDIVGAAVVVERIVLPPRAEATLADRPDAAKAARAHPAAQDMRIVVAVTRDGQQMSVLRLRGAGAATDDSGGAGAAADVPPAATGPGVEGDDSVLTGTDLVPGLAEALLATFR